MRRRGRLYVPRQSSSLRGHYIYGDYCSGQIWVAKKERISETAKEWKAKKLALSGLTISSFGEDSNGSLYIIDYHKEGEPTSIYKVKECDNSWYRYRIRN